MSSRTSRAGKKKVQGSKHRFCSLGETRKHARERARGTNKKKRKRMEKKDEKARTKTKIVIGKQIEEGRKSKRR